MQVQFFKSTWGMEGPLESVLETIESYGYDGFETTLDQLSSARVKTPLPVIGQSFPNSVEDLRRDLDRAGEFGAVLVDVQAGKDWWSFDKGSEFFEGSLRAVADSGLNVCFETHRGKLLFSPASTAEYLKRFPDLQITADFSHWTNVCESLLWDQEDSVQLAIQHVRYLHARVGHEEGPQVPDPRNPRWESQLNRFAGWWDQIKLAFEARNEPVLRVDPEFGPPNYMWLDPRDNQPVADLDEVCAWTREFLKNRWNLA